MHALALVKNLCGAPQKGTTILVLAIMLCTILVHFLIWTWPLCGLNPFLNEQEQGVSTLTKMRKQWVGTALAEG
jgi:hypothetical protein